MLQFLRMSSLEEIRREREGKRDALVAKGIEPYPARSNRTHRIAQAQAQFDAIAGAKTPVTLAGRIMSLRRHGGSTFADMFDGSDRLQVF
ncbi:MAG: lysine--tRNA ligase, partial [Acidobacteriota bacterium]